MKRETRIGASSRIRRARIWSRGFQVAITVATVVNVGVAALQWWTMRNTLEAGQRAWLLVKDVLPNDLSSNETPVQLLIENVGKGPAVNIRMRTMVAVGTRDLPIPPPEEGGTSLPSVSVIGPGHTHSIVAHLSKTLPEHLADAKAGRARLYVYGRIEYLDEFKRERRTLFCILYRRETPGRFGFCPKWNEIE